MRYLPLLLAIACIEYRPQGEEPPVYPPPGTVPMENIHQVDTSLQIQRPIVDILWVVDNSCSMADEQNSLTGNFPAFADFFVGSGLDYHIGVTSTDIDGNYNGSKGKLVTSSGYKYIDPYTVDPVGVFTSMATLGISGSGSEKGIGATYMVLETHRDTINAGFYRDEAALHTIVISDEPDYTPASLITQDEFINWYDDLKDEQGKTFSSIVDKSDGGDYLTVTRAIGGIERDITSEDWPLMLEQLGLQAAGLRTEYFLTQLPIVDTIEVAVDDVSGAHLVFQTTDWTYSTTRNSITFLTYIPESLSTVIVEYDVLASAVQIETSDSF